MSKKKKNIELLKKTHTNQEIRELNNYKRIVVSMSTGTVSFKSPKDYDRKREKADIRKMVKEYC